MKILDKLIIVLVLLLGLYPIAELSRLIIGSMNVHPGIKGQLIAEIAIMWVLYLGIIPTLLWAFRKSKKQEN